MRFRSRVFAPARCWPFGVGLSQSRGDEISWGHVARGPASHCGHYYYYYYYDYDYDYDDDDNYYIYYYYYYYSYYYVNLRTLLFLLLGKPANIIIYTFR